MVGNQITYTDLESISFVIMLLAHNYHIFSETKKYPELIINGSDPIKIKSLKEIKFILDEIPPSQWVRLNVPYEVKVLLDDIRDGYEFVESENGTFVNWVEAQRLLQEKYASALKEFYKRPPEERAVYKAIAALAELIEVLHELPTKFWKKAKPVNKEALAEELADVLHFIAEIALDLNISPSTIARAYYIKNAKNLLRQEGFYGEEYHIRKSQQDTPISL